MSALAPHLATRAVVRHGIEMTAGSILTPSPKGDSTGKSRVEQENQQLPRTIITTRADGERPVAIDGRLPADYLVG